MEPESLLGSEKVDALGRKKPDLRVHVVCCSWSLAAPVSSQVCKGRRRPAHIVSTGAMMPFRIRSRRRYCSRHLAGSGWGFSSASWGIAFFDDLGVGGFVSLDDVRGSTTPASSSLTKTSASVSVAA